MSEPILKPELTPEEIAEFETVAEGLAKKYNVSKVHLYIGIAPDTNERVVAYFKEPNFVQKIFTMDKVAMGGMFSAADALREIITLKEESDPRTFSDNSVYDEFKMGAVGTCVEIIEVVKNSYKKK
jgi:hypothetical protein